MHRRCMIFHGSRCWTELKILTEFRGRLRQRGPLRTIRVQPRPFAFPAFWLSGYHGRIAQPESPPPGQLRRSAARQRRRSPRATESELASLKYQARRRAVGEQPSPVIRNPSFGGSNTAAAIQDDALCLDRAGFRRDRADERNLELDGRLTAALLEGGLDGEAHAAVEQRSRQAAMHRAGWIEVRTVRSDGDDDTPAHRLGHVVAQRFSNRIEGQRPIGEPLHEFQAAHLGPPVGTDGPIALGYAAGHWLTPSFTDPTMVTWQRPDHHPLLAATGFSRGRVVSRVTDCGNRA